MANRELFQQLYNQISSQPDSLDMREWVEYGTQGRLFTNPITLKEGVRTCGTTRCAFGWVSFFEAGPDIDPVEWAVQELARLEADGVVTDAETDVYSATTLVGAHRLDIGRDEAQSLFLYTEGREAVELIRAYADGIIE